MTTGSVHHRDNLYSDSFSLLNSLISPWQWLVPAPYRRHVASVADRHPHTVATAHGPLLTNDAIGDSSCAAAPGRPGSRRRGVQQCRGDVTAREPVRFGRLVQH
jgi:hypothetical protein